MKNKTSKILRTVTAAGTLAVLFSTSSYAYGNQVLKESLVVAQRADVKTLDPQKSIDTISNKVIHLMFEPLILLNENMELVPLLAEKWEHIDELNTVFHLKKGVKFHNGETMTAEDVVFSLNRARKSAQTGYNFTPIINIEALDEYTVKITTDNPFGAMLKYLAQTSGCIISKKAAETMGDDFSLNPVGTGPYRFKKWTPGDRIETETFQEYHSTIPKNKRVVVRNIPEVSNRMIALETGEIDIAFDIGIMDRDAVQNHKDLKLMEVESPSILYLAFDETNPMFQNLKLKQAIAYAIDNEVLADVVFRGSALPGDSPMPPAIPGYNPNIKKYDQDIELAKQLLKEAGYENGLKMELWVDEQSSRVDMATVIQDQVKEIGIDMEIKVWEWGAYLSRTVHPNKELYLLSWNVSSVDGDGALYPMFHSKEQGVSANRSYYKNEKVDELLLQARYSIDQEKRKDLYSKAQELIQEDLPHYNLVYPKLNLGARKAVKNLKLLKNGYTDLAAAYVVK